MHVKNTRNMKFNGQIFKIHTQKKKIYEKFKKFFPNQFEVKFCSSTNFNTQVAFIYTLNLIRIEIN